MTGEEIFSRYCPLVQDYIYANGWRELRPVQIAAGDVLFGTEDNLILSSDTASGKTEAAFFPIITDLTENPSSCGRRALHRAAQKPDKRPVSASRRASFRFRLARFSLARRRCAESQKQNAQ